jgi:hypothetical protein
MKKNILKLVLFSCLIIFGQQVLAQGGPPNPPENPSTQGPPVGGNAPIGGGIELLLVMGLAYGSKKTYKIWKKNSEELES